MAARILELIIITFIAGPYITRAEPVKNGLSKEEVKQSYVKNCQNCHGDTFKLKEQERQKIYEIITKGTRGMPAFKHISEEERQALTDYVLKF